MITVTTFKGRTSAGSRNSTLLIAGLIDGVGRHLESVGYPTESAIVENAAPLTWAGASPPSTSILENLYKKRDTTMVTDVPI